jgi:hypothetical protein
MLRTFALASVLAAFGASAQDLGLDFSEAKTPPEFKPSILFIGITPSEADAILSVRAKLLEQELLKVISETEMFAEVKTPTQAAGVSTEARKCTDFSCLEALAEKTNVHRIVFGNLTKSGPNTLLTFSGFDPTLPAVLPAQVESSDQQPKPKAGGFAGIAAAPPKSQAQLDKEFIAKARPVFNELLKPLETPLGKLSIDVIDQKAVTRVKGKELGTGSFEKAVPSTNYDVEVTLEGYLPFGQTVHVDPMKTTQVKVTLIAQAVERPIAEAKAVDEGNAVYKRPGALVAAVGLVALAVGVYFGSAAGGISKAATNNGGTYSITRAQAKSAYTDALLANILIPVGAVALAAGGVWAFVLPMFQKKPAAAPGGPVTPAESGGEGQSTSLGITFGLQGRF